MSINFKGFSTKEVTGWAKVSRRQLRWWEEGLIFSSSPSKHRRWQRRHYTLEDLICILVIKSLIDRGISLYRIRKSVERARVAGVENPLAKFRVACLANSVIFKKEGKFIDPISGQMVIEEAIEIIRPRINRDLLPDIETIVKQAESHFASKIGAF
jgi:DNA-binding transcriptional MerR regulator